MRHKTKIADRHWFGAQWLLALVFVLLSACVTSPQDTSDGIMVAKYTLAGVNNTIATLVTGKQISLEEARQLAARADNTEAMLKAANAAARAGNADDAAAFLRSINAALIELQRVLESRQ